MTQREFLNSVLEANVNEELNDYAKTAIAKIDESNAKKIEKKNEKKLEEKPLYDSVTALLSDSPITASEVFNSIEEISSFQKASSILRDLVKDGIAKSEDFKKEKRVVKGYTLA